MIHLVDRCEAGGSEKNSFSEPVSLRGRFLRGQKAVNLWVAENFLRPEKPGTSHLNVVPSVHCRIPPRQHSKTVSKVFCFSNPNLPAPHLETLPLSSL